MNYQYWIIRYVPNVARGEFTNIGIVCGTNGGDWAAHFDTRGVSQHGGLRSDLRELTSWQRWFQRQIATYHGPSFDGDNLSSGWIEHLRARQANSIQFSEPTPIDVDSASHAIDLLYPLLVERDVQRRGRRGVTRVKMRTGLREAFQYERELVQGRDLFVQPHARVGRQRGVFDLGRDERADTVLTNTWAFNVATLDDLERDVQSWNYLVSRFRDEGGELSFDAQTRSFQGDERIEVVYDPPTISRDATRRVEIFEAAREAWSLNGIMTAEYEAYVADLRQHNQYVNIS